MNLRGAIIPQPGATGAVLGAVQAVPTPYDAPEPTRRGIGRHRRRGRETVVADRPAVLDYAAPGQLTLPITGFGNLTTGDAYRVADALAVAAAEWSPARVRFSGGAALDFPGDWSVWARLTGDLDALGVIARGVTGSVEALGLYVDRRIFRPMVAIATVTQATTGPYLQAVVDALGDFEGEEWIVDGFSLLRDSFVDGRPQATEFQRIQIGS